MYVFKKIVYTDTLVFLQSRNKQEKKGFRAYIEICVHLTFFGLILMVVYNHSGKRFESFK